MGKSKKRLPRERGKRSDCEKESLSPLSTLFDSQYGWNYYHSRRLYTRSQGTHSFRRNSTCISKTPSRTHLAHSHFDRRLGVGHHFGSTYQLTETWTMGRIRDSIRSCHSSILDFNYSSSLRRTQGQSHEFHSMGREGHVEVRLRSRLGLV